MLHYLPCMRTLVFGETRRLRIRLFALAVRALVAFIRVRDNRSIHNNWRWFLGLTN